jgi:hypothetical protein
MKESDIHLVLDVLKKNRGKKFEYKDLYEYFSSKFSWHDFLTILDHLYEKSCIDEDNKITEIGLATFNEVESINRQAEANLKQQQIDAKWTRWKTKFEVINTGLLILGIIISTGFNVYQFYNRYNQNTILKQKEKTIDSLSQVVLELGIQNITTIHMDTLTKEYNDTIRQKNN